MREYIATIIIIAFTSICFWGMNQFGFQNQMHDVLWSIGAAFALLIILILDVYIYFIVCKETPWAWKKGEKINS